MIGRRYSSTSSSIQRQSPSSLAALRRTLLSGLFISLVLGSIPQWRWYNGVATDLLVLQPYRTPLYLLGVPPSLITLEIAGYRAVDKNRLNR